MLLPIVSFLHVLTLCLPHTYKFKLSVPKVKNFLKVKSTLKSKPEWVTVLDGTQEGAFQWVSLANLLSFCVYSVGLKSPTLSNNGKIQGSKPYKSEID